MEDYTRVNTGSGSADSGKTIRSRIVFEKRAGKPVRGEVLHLLLGGQMLLGRDDSCDIQVQDDRVSRKHAMIQIEGSAARMVDLGSTNGTTRNDIPVTDEIILVDNDRICLADSVTFDVRIVERNGVVGSVRLATGSNAFLLAPTDIIIGRVSKDNPACDLMIYDPEISVAHAKIEHFYNNTFIVALDPEKEVLVNGNPVKELEIKSGSVISIGQSAFQWELLG